MTTTVRKITLQTVRSMQPGEELRDTELKGFGARRQQASISYFVHTRVNGRLRRITIGRHGSPWTPETARKEAARLLVAIRSGADPVAERLERRRTGDRFEDVAQHFLEAHGPRLKPRTREEYSRLIQVHLGRAFKGKPISEITASDVARAHHAWRQTPRTANFAVSVLSKLLNWADTHGYQAPEKNPCANIERYREVKRERYLSEDELVRLGKALTDAENDGANAWAIAVIRLLILTGARHSEITTLKWDYLDLPRRILRLPDSKTGSKTIVLNAEAVAVLEAVPRLTHSPWVFPGNGEGGHLMSARSVWEKVREQAELSDIRLHDLRHSFASIAIDVGGTLPVIGHLLGHTQAQTTARYAHVAPSPAHRIADAAGARIAAAWRETAAGSASPSDDD